MKILLLVEHDNKTVKHTTLHTLSAAQQLNAEVDLLVVGHECQSVVSVVAKLEQVKRVLVADALAYKHQLAENVAALLADLAPNYAYILAPASTYGKNILPRAAALLDVAMVSDVVKIISADTFVRPIYAGNALATVQATDAIKLLTIRATAFPAAQVSATEAIVQTVNKIFPNTLSHFDSAELSLSARPELTAARVVISGGRGLKSAENFKQLEILADLLGAAIGASRAAVDAGFAPNDYQVGQTGKVVAPDLYIAVGISGAIQHLAGMKDSKVIVAINNDADAPIFQIADYGLVGDLFVVLHELQEQLAR